MQEPIKKYYSCYREGILTSDIVEQIDVYCVESKIPLPNWYELEPEEAAEWMADGIIFKEL